MSALPPLLAPAAGWKVRPRKAPTIRPREIELHIAVAKVLRQYCKLEFQWTHIGHGEVRDIRTAAKLKRMGLKRGWPDIVLVPPGGQLHCLELKRIVEKLTADQELFRGWCDQHGVPYQVAHSFDQAITVLDAWGCLTVRMPARPEGGAA